MSTRNEKARVERPFKIDVYGLQDNYIGTLQSYGDSFLGQVVSPRLSISDDGTQTFTCSIPKYFIDPTTNEKKINPRWEDAEEGVLAENVRILKIFIQKNGKTEVYPMVIDKITDSRDSHFTIYKQVEASGLAFAELGKVGYKLELTKDIVLDEIKAAQDIHKWDKEYDNPPKLDDDKTIVTNINYWLDKVFPNQKDENNNITKWLTPWCYEIRMDWKYYAENRDSSKIYDDAFISNWAVQGVGDKATLVPTEKTEQQEKARLVDCKNSNKYNITQDIAEAFEVFCRYEYKCDQNGKFIKTYTDDEGKVWTGRKVIFYNRAIKQEDPIVVDYQKNLQSIERTSDSSEVYTKLYVTKLEAEEMSNGYVTIADTAANPLRDEFILNFDYLDNTGALNDYQRQFIGLYKTGIADANRKLIPLLEAEEEGVADLVELKAKESFYENEKKAAQEEYQYYKDLHDNFNSLGAVTKDKDNSYSAIFVEETKDGPRKYASLGLYGINTESIVLHKDSTYSGFIVEKPDPDDNNKTIKEDFNSSQKRKIVYNVPDELENNILYIQLNEYGYPKRLYCKSGSEFDIGTVYLGLEYTPENEYKTVYQYFENKILAAVDNKGKYAEIVAAKTEELKQLEISVQTLLKLKDDLNSKLERILGPALREGYWTPDDYEDHASQVIKELKDRDVLEPFWDTKAYSFETDGSYLMNGAEGNRKYYPYIKLKESGIDFSKNAPNTLILYENGELQSAPITAEIPAGWKWFQIGDTRYYIYLSEKQTPPEDKEDKKYFTFIKNGDKVSFTLPNKTTYTLANSKVFRTTAPSGDNVPDPIPELHPAFDNINRNWTAHYYGVHFKYGYIDNEPEDNKLDNEPCIILLTEEGNSLNENSHFSYTFEGDNPVKDVTGGYVCKYDKDYIVQHPRIRIKEKNVQTTSSLFTIVNMKNEKILERYKDYVVVISDSYPIITLKPNEKNGLEDIQNSMADTDEDTYKIGYTSSKANEYMYLDAIQVAKDNSIPRYTYSLKIANLPHDFSHIELGQMLYINDHSLGVHAATGYVNKIDYALDQPQEDGVEVQNYKTKFEDLFSTITAQSEAMKTNRRAYEIAAQAFTSTANGGVMGQISGSVLQSALKNNSYLLNWSATGVEITPDQGIILTNKTPYSNGVTGQVILQGGGIFLSDSIDANGNRIWSQAITPHGINASLINAGQLNTDKILVYAGDNMAFQWNPEGIHAYKIDESGLSTDVYVKYSQHGLHLINDTLSHTDKDGNKYDKWPENLRTYQHQSLVSVDWNGLTLRNHNGDRTLYADLNGNLSITGTLQSSPFVSGSKGWCIEQGGHAEFNDIVIRSSLQSANYTDDSIIGTGWKIDEKGYGVFNDLKVRGTISAAVFEYQETSAVGGELYVAPTIILESQYTERATLADWLNTIKVEVPFRSNNNKYILAGREWKVGDLLGLNGCIEWRVKVNSKDVADKGYDRIRIRNEEGQFEEYYQVIYEIKNYRVKIKEITTETWKDESQHDIIKLEPYSGKLDATTQNLLYDKNGNQISLGKAFANFGLINVHGSGRWNLIFLGSADTGREGILITAMAEQSPYIDILNDFAYEGEKGETLINNSPRVRLGNLNGLWNNNPTRNFLVNDLKIDEKSDLGYGLFADNVYLRGSIYADNGYFKGDIHATSGYFNGDIHSENAYIKGEIHATSGKIGSLTIDEVETGHGQLTLKLVSDTNFVYTNATNVHDINCEVYFANKRITKKSDLPQLYQDVNFTFSYERQVNGTWGKFNDGSWKELSLFNPETGNIIPLKFTSSTPLTNTYRAHLELSKTVLSQKDIYSSNCTFAYVKDGSKGDKGDKGESIQGAPGAPAKNYYLAASANSVSVDVDGYNPSSITITATYSEGNGAPQAFVGGQLVVNLLSVDSNNYATSTEITTTPSNNTYTFTVTNTNLQYARRYEIILKVNGQQVQSLSIPFTLSARMRELGKIVNNEVIINDGRIYAEALTAGSIVSGKVSAGAIQTGAIASNSYLYLFGGLDSAKYTMPPEFKSYNAATNKYETNEWQPVKGGTLYKWSSTVNGSTPAQRYANALVLGMQDIWNNAFSVGAKSASGANGVRIGPDGVRIRGGGIFEVHMNNFTLDEAGNLKVIGTVEATSGKIGGWTIGQNSLNNNSNIYLYGNTVTTEATEDNNNNVIEITNGNQKESVFTISSTGNLTCNGGTVLEDLQYKINNNIYTIPGIIYTEGEEPRFSSKGMLWLKKAGTSIDAGATISSALYIGSISQDSTNMKDGIIIPLKQNSSNPLSDKVNYKIKGKIYYRAKHGYNASTNTIYHGAAKLTYQFFLDAGCTKPLTNTGSQNVQSTVSPTLKAVDVNTHDFSIDLNCLAVPAGEIYLKMQTSAHPDTIKNESTGNILSPKTTFEYTVYAVQK